MFVSQEEEEARQHEWPTKASSLPLAFDTGGATTAGETTEGTWEFDEPKGYRE